METAQAIGEGLTFENVWAMMQAAKEQMEASSREMDKRFAKTDEQIAKTDRQIEETTRQMEAAGREMDKRFAKTDEQIAQTDRQIAKTIRQMEATDRQMSKLGKRFGEVIECMVVPNLVAKFQEIGFEFTKTHRDTEIVDREHDIILEVDAFLENGDKVMIVEIKSKPCMRDIDDHVERMDKLRRYADLHNDKRAYLGAIGGAVFNENEKNYALKKGFYALEPSGETFKIIKPEGKCRPREW